MRKAAPTLASLCLATGVAMAQDAPAQAPSLQGSFSLPRPDYKFQGRVGRTVQESDRAAFPQPVRPPNGAPNVLLILLDDVGFGQFSVFGGGVPSPAMEKLAAEGLRYNRFHTTAMCSPTRASLITGRAHHAVGFGLLTETATGYDGYTSIIPKSSGTIAEILRQNGYATAWFGKNHNTPIWETSAVGPFDNWPRGWGFEYFYGFNAGDISQLRPILYENTTRAQPSTDPDYHLSTDLADRTIDWIRQTKQIDPQRPFFAYLAPGATHMPHQPPAKWRDRFKGQFDAGWDRYREQTFERQKKLGVIPQDAKLTPRSPTMPAWDSLPPERQRLHARQMELFAAYAAHADHEVGRVLDAVAELPDAANTLIIYIIGDNGASAEGFLAGTHNEVANNNGLPPSWEEQLKFIDELGGEKHYNHFSAVWAWAMNTPFQYTKVVGSHFGGTRNPMIISWPAKIKDRGGLRTQLADVSDIMPTVLEAAGVRAPDVLNGVQQDPITGISLEYSFDSAKAASRRMQLMFELMSNRAMISDGWMISAYAVLPWTAKPGEEPDIDKTTWELYHIDEDFSQANDLAKQYPDRVRHLESLWWAEAARNKVLPVDTRTFERGSDELMGRPVLTAGRKRFEYSQQLVALPEASAPNLKNKSFTIIAEAELPQGQPAQGMLFTQGGNTGGWGFYVLDGKLVGTHNFVDRERYRVVSTENVPAGKATLTLDFAYDGGGMGKGGTITLRANGKVIGQGRVEKTPPAWYAISEGQDIGQDLGTPIDDSYALPFKFTGTLRKLTVELK